VDEAVPLTNSVGNQRGVVGNSKWMTTPEGKERLRQMMKQRWRNRKKRGYKFLGKSTVGNRGNRTNHGARVAVRAEMGSLAERAVKASVAAHSNGTGPAYQSRARKHVAHVYYLDAKGELHRSRVAFSGLGDLVDLLITKFAAHTLTEARLEFEV
jgi:hypothetical protein